MIIESIKPMSMDVSNEETAQDGSNVSSTSRTGDSQPLRRSTRRRDVMDRDTSESEEKPQKPPLKFVISGVEYCTYEYVYFEVPNEPYYTIGYVEDVIDRDKEKIQIRRFLHTFEIPDYSKDILDRKINTVPSRYEKIRSVLAREVFNTDNLVVVDGKQLRGKCSVKSFAQLSDAVDNFDPTKEDSFFNAYCFKEETNHVIPISPRVKVGDEYQVIELPAYRGPHPRKQICPIHGVTNHHHLREKQNTISTNGSSGDNAASVPVGSKRPYPTEKGQEKPGRIWEEIVWDHKAYEENFEDDSGGGDVLNGSFEMFIAMARSVISMNCVGGGLTDQESAENAKAFVESVTTTQHIYDTLHRCGYDCQRTLEELRTNSVSATNTPMHWTVDQVKQFATALRQVGRNFFLIQKRYFSPATSIDPFDGPTSRYPPRYPRGRKRRRQVVDDSSSCNNQQQEEQEGNSETLDAPNNDEGEENVLEPIDEEAVDSPQAEEPDDNYLFIPTKEKSVKELIEFFHFWKKKKAQPNMCFTGIRSPALTNDADDKKAEVAKSKKNKKAEPDPLAADGDNGPSSTQCTKYTGPCKFCSDGIVDNQSMETTLNIVHIADFQLACSKCRLHYFKYCFMPGRGEDALSSLTEPNKRPQLPSSKSEAKNLPECFCAVSPTYASCHDSPEPSLNGHELDGQEDVEVKDEGMGSAEKIKEDVKSPLEQTTLPIPSSTLDTKAEIPIEISSAEQSRELEAAIPHQAVPQSTTAGYGNMALETPDRCPRTDVSNRVPPEQTTSAVYLPPEYEQIFKSCGLEKLQTLIQTGHLPPSTTELIKQYLLMESEHQQPMNLMAASGSSSSGNRLSTVSNISSSTSQPTMTTHARGTFYPPTGVPPPCSSSTQQYHHHHRSHHQSGTTANQRQQSSASVRTPSSTHSPSRPQYLPPQQQQQSTAPPPPNRNVLPEHAAQFLRDQQFAAQRAAQSTPTTGALQQQQLGQQYAALFNSDVLAMLSSHFKNPNMQYYLQQLLQRESQQRAEFPPEMYQAAMMEFYSRMMLSEQMRRASIASSGGGDVNVRVPQGPPMPQHHPQQPAPTMSPFQHPAINPTSSTTRENAFFTQQQQAQNLRVSVNPAPPPPIESCQRGAPVFYPQLSTQHFQQQQQQQQQLLLQRSAQPQQQSQQSSQQQQPSSAQLAAYQQNSGLYELIQRYVAAAASGVAPSAASALAPDTLPPRHPGMAHQHSGSSSSQQQHPQPAAHLNFMHYLQFVPPEQQQMILQNLIRQQQQQGGSSGSQ
nr:arginine glutamic acid dipeptide (RE) repeats [Hymenolepis microstoma]